MCDYGVGDALVLELYPVAEVFTACLFDLTLVHAIILWRRGDVPSIHRMERPCDSFLCLFVELELATQWCQYHLVVVKWAAHVGVG